MRANDNEIRRGTELTEEWGVHCNVAEPRKASRTGAKAWIMLCNPGWGGERLEILVRSRGGREIVIWEARKHLKDFRAGWVPEHLRRSWGARHVMTWSTREEAQAWADTMNRALVREDGQGSK